MATKNETIGSSQLYKTSDYGQFKTIAGNRYEDKRHTRHLARKIEKEGNLTQYFPIIVNERMEVIDGLHRLRALESLGYPAYFEIKEGLNVSSVISFNTGHKNWTWRDYAASWSERGNRSYAQFLELADMFDDRFSVLLYYATGEDHKKIGESYQSGEFVIKDFDTTRKLLLQWQELKEAAGYTNRDFAFAAHKYMRTPRYDHQKMLRKVSAYGERFHNCYTMYDYLSALDEMWKTND